MYYITFIVYINAEGYTLGLHPVLAFTCCRYLQVHQWYELEGKNTDSENCVDLYTLFSMWCPTRSIYQLRQDTDLA